MSRKLIQSISGAALWGFRAMFSLLPHGMAVRTGAVIGGAVYRLYPRRRQIALSNLRAAFPEMTDTEREDLARRVFRNFGRTGAEFLRVWRIDPQRLAQIVEIKGAEYIDHALASGQGAIMITAHFGNWELMAKYLTQLGYPLSVVARDANDRKTTEMVNDIRESSGYRVFSRGNAVRYILTCLRQNELVGILPDQNAADLFVDFFGQPCGSVAGPAVIHIRTGAPIIPIFCVRLPGDRHRIEVKPPLETHLTGDTERDTQTIMTRVHAAIEDQVRRYPDQWLWFHDRWKAARSRQEPSAVG